MNTKQILIGAATAIGLFGTTLSTMADNPNPKDWAMALCGALAAGIMAAVNPTRGIKDQFKKEEK
jgi:hypothetical protein